MGRLIYASIASLDLFVDDEQGRFDWAAPDAELHAFVNDLERPVGTHLYGRRLYETMAVWDTMETSAADPELHDYARIWRAADKVVYSSSLGEVTTARTHLERSFDAAAVRALVRDADRDVAIGGPTLAAHALAADLVDELHLFLHPLTVGGGTPALPRGLALDLELVDERRFASGVVHLHHRVRR